MLNATSLHSYDVFDGPLYGFVLSCKIRSWLVLVLSERVKF